MKARSSDWYTAISMKNLKTDAFRVTPHARQRSRGGEGRGGKGGGEALKLPPEQQAKLGRGEMVAVEDEYGFTYLRKSFADASADLEHYLSKPLKVSLPCRIAQCQRVTLPQRTVWS